MRCKKNTHTHKHTTPVHSTWCSVTLPCIAHALCACALENLTTSARKTLLWRFLTCFYRIVSGIPMSSTLTLKRRRRRSSLLLTSHLLLLLISCSDAYVHESVSVGKLRVNHLNQHHFNHNRLRSSTCWASDTAYTSSKAGVWTVCFSVGTQALRASAQERIEVKRTARNPVDTSQVRIGLPAC